MSKKSVVLSVEEKIGTGTGFARRLRRQGKIPAIVYSKGKETKEFTVNGLEWETACRKGEIHLVELKKKEGETINALIREIQHDALKGMTLHIDFQEVRMDEVIQTRVTVHGKGTAVGISQGGVLEQVMHEIEVSCLPKDIPESIEVDVSSLELDKAIQIKDLVLPEGVKPVDPPNQTVFHVIQLRVEAESTATAEGAEGAAAGTVEGAASAEPEVIKKGKKEEEGEEEESKEKEKKK